MQNKIYNIDKIINASSVAIVGASTKIGSVGYNTLKNIIDYGFEGQIFPINPKYDEILGIKAYKSVLDVPSGIDLAVIAVPSTSVKAVIEDCHKKNIVGVLILSSGFKESGEQGKALENEIMALIKKYEMSVVGPNSIGILNANTKLNATFTKNAPKFGKIALISQSGALGCGIMNTMDNLPIGISKMVSIGNQGDLNVNDFIEYFARDDEVEQIILYLEGIVEPNEFRRVCLKASKTKPIFAIKAGRSKNGSKATLSHTGSLAGNDGFADAIMKQAGVIRESDLESILNSCYVHSLIKNTTSKNTVILTNGMGPAILTADKMSDYNLNLAEIKDDIKQSLIEILSPLASVNNPIDMVATAEPEIYEKVIKILLNDSDIDTLIVIYLELSATPSSIIHQSIEKLKALYPNKAIIDVYITSNSEYEKTLNLSKSVPAFKYTDDAVAGVSTLNRYNSIKSLSLPKTIEYTKNEKIVQILKNAKDKKQHLLTTAQSLEILKNAGVPTTENLIIHNQSELMQKIEKINFPVVLKISSTTLSHKSDVKGVITNISSSQVLIEEFGNLCKNLEMANELQNIDAFIIQKMEKSTRELVVGFTRDNNYGAVLMFGHGGIFIEAQNDVSFRVSPLSEYDIDTMIKDTRVHKLLGNLRGLPSADYESIEKCIKNIDILAQTYPEMRELDINPLLIDDKTGQAIAVDARIVID